MTDFHQNFTDYVTAGLNDDELHTRIDQARNNYLKAFETSASRYPGLETLRQKASYTRWKAIESLDKYLIEFESNFIKRGGKVIWAQDNLEAVSEIIGIIKRSGEPFVVKSKSLTTEEIGLDDAFTQQGMEWVETDIGQYILQLKKDRPSHMVMPAIHLSSEDIANLFHEKLGVDDTASTKQLVDTSAGLIREKIRRTGVGITGANFLIANPGAVSITENEGNALLTAARSKVHIVVAGIDKVIPALSDLDHLLPLLSLYGTGQPITTYNSVISGPSKESETDGPQEMYVVLIDNGRSGVLAEHNERRIMHCLRCGSCQYHDPVYRVIGGSAYQSTWLGPVGTIIQPHLRGLKEAGFMSELSTLSGEDSANCPVNIPFNKLLLSIRKKNIKKNPSGSRKMFYYLWKKVMLNSDRASWKNHKAHRYYVNHFFLRSEKGLRDMPTPARESFNDAYRKKFS